MTGKVIAVLGATGAQGGGLVKAILADPAKEFAVRAVTRKLDSDKAKALAASGADVVAADLDDVASLTKAFEGAYGVFVVTNFWEHFSADKEIQQLKNVAEAASKAGVKHVVNSTLEDVRTFVPLTDDRIPTLHGKWKVPHFDGKGEAAAEFEKLGVPTTQYLTSFYWENFVGFFPFQGQPDGTYTVTFPLGDKPMSGVGVDDIGGFALAIFKNPSKFIGKKVGVAGEHITCEAMAAAISKATGKQVKYVDVPADVYRGFGFPGADDLGNMFQFYRDFSEPFMAARDIALVKEVYPQLKNFDQWLEAKKQTLVFKDAQPSA